MNSAPIPTPFIVTPEGELLPVGSQYGRIIFGWDQPLTAAQARWWGRRLRQITAEETRQSAARRSGRSDRFLFRAPPARRSIRGAYRLWRRRLRRWAEFSGAAGSTGAGRAARRVGSAPAARSAASVPDPFPSSVAVGGTSTIEPAALGVITAPGAARGCSPFPTMRALEGVLVAAGIRSWRIETEMFSMRRFSPEEVARQFDELRRSGSESAG